MNKQTSIWGKLKKYASTVGRIEPKVVLGQIYIVANSIDHLEHGFGEQIEELMKPYCAGVYWIDSYKRYERDERRTQNTEKTYYGVGASIYGPSCAIRVIKGHPALDFDSYVAGALACRHGGSALVYDINTPNGLAGAIGWGMWFGLNFGLDYDTYPTTNWPWTSTLKA